MTTVTGHTEEDSQRLFDILCYRVLDFPLAEISDLLAQPLENRRRQLLP